jgi:hypothetical protein
MGLGTRCTVWWSVPTVRPQRCFPLRWDVARRIGSHAQRTRLPLPVCATSDARPATRALGEVSALYTENSPRPCPLTCWTLSRAASGRLRIAHGRFFERREEWDVPESLDPPALRMFPARSDRDFSRPFG